MLVRFHRKDVLDLQWSTDGVFLISGSVDNCCIIWDVNKGKIIQHKKICQLANLHEFGMTWCGDDFYIKTTIRSAMSFQTSKLNYDKLLQHFLPKCIDCLYFRSPGSVNQILDAHSHYVQGVAWDPLGKYIASLSSDRTCRIYVHKPQPKSKGIDKMNYVCQHIVTKVEQTTDDCKVI